MPEKILALLEKGSLTEWQLAKKLKISVEEVKACMDYLQQMGFIRSERITPTGNGCSGCSGNCGKCGCNISTNSSYIIWEIV